jgi:hypothetical protein
MSFFSWNRHIEQKEQQIKKVLKSKNGNEEEVNPNQFQDDVLSCLRELQHLAETIKEKANDMEYNIKRFKTTIHGEDVDAQ